VHILLLDNRDDASGFALDRREVDSHSALAEEPSKPASVFAGRKAQGDRTRPQVRRKGRKQTALAADTFRGFAGRQVARTDQAIDHIDVVQIGIRCDGKNHGLPFSCGYAALL
jgi:hypothetical protein